MVIFVAAVTSMYQSLLEGKTDCPISGVFGAGKTLSAAAMIAGLLVFFVFLLYAAWVRSPAERPSVSYTKVVMEVTWTGHNLQYTKTN